MALNFSTTKGEPLRVAWTGGATGGHLFPLISVLRILKLEATNRHWVMEHFYLGAPAFKSELLIAEGVKYYPIISSKLRRYFDLQNLIDIIKFPIGLFQALKVLYTLMPNVLFSKGGPGSFQVVLAAWLLRIPILIHESDTVPGRTNLWSARLATRIGVSFTKTKIYFPASKTAVVGNPIDPAISQLVVTPADYENFQLDLNRKIILIFGGSQGAQGINNIVVESIADFLALGQVIHQIGEANFEQVRLEAQGFILRQVPMKNKDYHPFGFVPHQGLLKFMKMADIIIARAGSSIFEIAAVGTPSILVPLPATIVGRHQVENAYAYADVGAAAVIEEANLTPHLLISLVKKILSDEETRQAMRQAAQTFAKPEAAQQVAQELIYLMTQ